MESKRVEQEYQTFMEGNLWPLVYQRIGQRCQSYPYTCIEAKKTENKPLNRYRDVNPYDHSRTIIRKEGFVTDYINANLVKMERANRQYILTQGPLVYTSGHFWLMVWEQNSPAIIMLNKIIEKSEIKCHWYWPHENGDAYKVVYPDVNMSITQISETDYNYYTIRLLKMTYHDTEDSREIWHFHYTTWPDFEVPQSPHAFLNFLYRVRENHLLECVDGQGPAIVHCSAGIGRSGTFCLVDSVLVLIEKEGQDNVEIQEILLEMRRYRMGLIQTSEQLRFSYAAIVEGIKQLDPDYKPDEEKAAEVIYAVVAEEEEAPPPPPPRGESLGRPPARPLPAIPASASMAEMGLYARRRARAEAKAAAQQSGGVVPSLTTLARAAVFGEQPHDQPSTLLGTVPPLLLLATSVVLAIPVNELYQPLSHQEQLDMFYDPSNQELYSSEELVVASESNQETESELDDSSASDEDPSTAYAALYTSSDDSTVTDHYLEHDHSVEEELNDVLWPTPDSTDFSNIEMSTNAESEDSDAPPTPPPRDSAPREMPRDSQRDTPSPASSAYADEDNADDDDTTTETTETENADIVESSVGSGAGEGDGVRRRKAEQLAERVALMKKRSREADRWHNFKRSLFKPLAFSFGLLAVAGVLIYVYAKH